MKHPSGAGSPNPPSTSIRGSLKVIGAVAFGCLLTLLGLFIFGAIGAALFTQPARPQKVIGAISSVSFQQGPQSWEITINGGDTYFYVPSLGGNGYTLDGFSPPAYSSQFRVGNPVTIWVDSDQFPTPAGGVSQNHEVLAVSFTTHERPDFTSDYYRHPDHKTANAWFWGRIAIGAAAAMVVLPILVLALRSAGRRLMSWVT
jgi:hypothetical protein